jgi:hypothetical protein
LEETPTVLDPQGEVQSWDWILANLGPLSLERAAATKLGQPVYRLVEVRVVAGPAVQVVRVLDTRGIPLVGIQVVRAWPGAPNLPCWSPPASRWQEHGVTGPTGRNGAIGFGLGSGDSYQLPGAGSASAWVADSAGPSDRIDGLGLLDSTMRLHVDLCFQLDQEMETVLPSTEPGQSIAHAVSASGLSLSQRAPVTVAFPPPPSPPPAPLSLTGDQWQILIERLDQVIAALEEQAQD